MIERLIRAFSTERRAATLALIILVQSLCALFFLSDVVLDFFEEPGGELDLVHLVAESVAAIALAAGVAYLMVELRQLLQRMDSMETGLRVARGDVVRVIDAYFDAWALTPAQRDVALLLLKGVDTETIAALRGTAKGTVRVQSASIYAKAGVDGKAQLISLFLEELLSRDDGTVRHKTPPT